MRQYFNSTMRPTAYQGMSKTAPYFEGWYFKMVDAAAETAWAVIPGIHFAKDPAHSTAFIMVIDGRSHEPMYHTFPIMEFQASAEMFDVRIGENHFSAESITLNLPNLKGKLTFQNNVPWPISVTSPGIMGWFAWMPFMECYHGIVSMDHAIQGQLVAGAETIDFSGGRGYIEKDWGQAFPETWVWLQANHFEQTGTSLFASIARIPFKGMIFPGFIIGLWHDGELHRFTTYLQSKLRKVDITPAHVNVVVTNRKYELSFSAERSPHTALLHKPTTDQGMIPAVNESIGAKVRIELRKRNGELIYEGTSGHAGLEVEGETKILEKP